MNPPRTDEGRRAVRTLVEILQCHDLKEPFTLVFLIKWLERESDVDALKSELKWLSIAGLLRELPGECWSVTSAGRQLYSPDAIDEQDSSTVNEMD